MKMTWITLQCSAIWFGMVLMLPIRYAQYAVTGSDIPMMLDCYAQAREAHREAWQRWRTAVRVDLDLAWCWVKATCAWYWQNPLKLIGSVLYWSLVAVLFPFLLVRECWQSIKGSGTR